MLSGMRTIGITAGGSGGNSATVDIDFPPVYTVVAITISRMGTSGGVARAGILNFRFRNSDGSDSQVDFPGGPDDPFNALPAAVSHDQMTHVTMQVETFDAWTRGLCTTYFWS